MLMRGSRSIRSPLGSVARPRPSSAGFDGSPFRSGREGRSHLAEWIRVTSTGVLRSRMRWLMATDGNLSGKKGQMSLISKDLDQIETMRRCLRLGAPISQCPDIGPEGCITECSGVIAASTTGPSVSGSRLRRVSPLGRSTFRTSSWLISCGGASMATDPSERTPIDITCPRRIHTSTSDSMCLSCRQAPPSSSGFALR